MVKSSVEKEEERTDGTLTLVLISTLISKFGKGRGGDVEINE